MTREPVTPRSLGFSNTGWAARDLAALTKPRITFVVLATCATGMAISPVRIGLSVAILALLGTALIVASANVFNMWWERDTDALMFRTRQRPLPAGRMAPHVALIFGLALGALSIPMLLAVNALTAVLGVLALVTYVLLYTPLKRHTWLALWVGAVPGATPPLMGWTAATGSLFAARGLAMAETSGILLSLLVFAWQLPHFEAIAIFRAEDYARADLKVVAVEQGERAAKRHIAGYTALLVSVSFGLARAHVAGFAFAISALTLGALFLVLAGWGLGARAGPRWAKGVFAYSIVYLSLLLAILAVDRIDVSRTRPQTSTPLRTVAMAAPGVLNLLRDSRGRSKGVGMIALPQTVDMRSALLTTRPACLTSSTNTSSARPPISTGLPSRSSRRVASRSRNGPNSTISSAPFDMS
jgi:protoheme IX farnesyltransferase